MHNDACRGLDAETDAIDDAVGYPDEFNSKGTALDRLSRQHRYQGNIFKLVFLQFLPDQTERERGTVLRGADLPEQEGKGAGMSLMAMGQKYPFHLGPVFEDIGEVWD